MSGQKEPRRHHTVPVVYLQNFTDENEQCWVFNDKFAFFHNAPKNILNRKDFNTITNRNGEKSYEIEKVYLNRLEGIYGKLVEKIINFERITLSDKKQLSFFIAAQFARTEKQRRTLVNILDQIKEKTALMNESLAGRNIPSFDSLPEELKRNSVSIEELDEQTKDMNTFHASTIPNTVNETWSYFYNMKWNFLVSRGVKFITSDDPVRLVDPTKISDYGESTNYTPVLTDKNLEINFPLTKFVSLLALKTLGTDLTYITVNDGIVETLNNRQLMHARQVILSDENDALLAFKKAQRHRVRNIFSDT